jgi:hypothetical protein
MRMGASKASRLRMWGAARSLPTGRAALCLVEKIFDVRWSAGKTDGKNYNFYAEDFDCRCKGWSMYVVYPCCTIRVSSQWGWRGALQDVIELHG